MTAKEHFDAHILLSMIYPENIDLAGAVMRMSKNKTLNREDYAIVKTNFARLTGIKNKGHRRNLGSKRSEATKLKMSMDRKNKPNWHKGLKRKKETCKRISESLLGKNTGPQSATHIHKRIATRSLTIKNRIKEQEFVDTLLQGQNKQVDGWIEQTVDSADEGTTWFLCMKFNGIGIYVLFEKKLLPKFSVDNYII